MCSIPDLAESLPYANNFFDVVLCVNVLEHVANLQQTLWEIHRVLKPGGLFCFDTINRRLKSKLIMIWLLEDLLQEIPCGIHDWQKFIPPEELTCLLQATGFQEMEVKGFNIFGETVLDNITAYLHYRKTGGFKISINEDISMMYVGKAEKSLQIVPKHYSHSLNLTFSFTLPLIL